MGREALEGLRAASSQQENQQTDHFPSRYYSKQTGMDPIERLRFLASLPRGTRREKMQPFNWIPSHRVMLCVSSNIADRSEKRLRINCLRL